MLHSDHVETKCSYSAATGQSFSNEFLTLQTPPPARCTVSAVEETAPRPYGCLTPRPEAPARPRHDGHRLQTNPRAAGQPDGGAAVQAQHAVSETTTEGQGRSARQGSAFIRSW